MKNYLTPIMAVLLHQFVFCQAAPVAADFDKLNWLQGEWKRLQLPAGRSGHERWVKIADHELKGWGVTMKGMDTAFTEKISIVVKDNLIFYVAETADNKEPVYFAVTKLTTSSFECENPKHDFPKKITYRLEGNRIKAAISGNGKTIDYLFEKQ